MHLACFCYLLLNVEMLKEWVLAWGFPKSVTPVLLNYGVKEA